MVVKRGPSSPAIVEAMDTGCALTSSSPELETAARRSQLVQALRSVDTAIEKVDERGEVTGLQRLREDLRSALRLHDGYPMAQPLVHA
jgi:hypothetical protein